MARLRDDLSGVDWQKVRNAQLAPGEQIGPAGQTLSDDLDPDAWQRLRTLQAFGATQAPETRASTFDVDREFLADAEGAKRKMYVPKNKAGQVIGDSGPTIGVGVDLGRKDVAYLNGLGISPDLARRLTPYLGKRRDEALTFVKANPLVLSQADYDALNSAVQDHELHKLATKFDAVSQVGPFASLPRNTQTAIGSLFFQYGTDAPEKAAPSYWRQVTSGDWEGAYRNLTKFGDAYQPRRDEESKKLLDDYVSGILPRTQR